jgi:hypothetical protein
VAHLFIGGAHHGSLQPSREEFQQESGQTGIEAFDETGGAAEAVDEDLGDSAAGVIGDELLSHHAAHTDAHKMGGTDAQDIQQVA